jgi:hypothetical protein
MEHALLIVAIVGNVVSIVFTLLTWSKRHV